MSAIEHFENGLAELRRRRTALERQITLVESMIQQLREQDVEPAQGSVGSGPSAEAQARTPRSDMVEVAVPAPTNGPWPSVRTVALELARQTPDRVITLKEVVAESQRAGNPSKYESVSSVLSTLKAEGVLESVARG